MKWII